MNLRLSLPELGRQATLNLQMIEVQFDDGDVPGEVAADVVHADVKPDHCQAFALRSDYHAFLLFKKDRMKQV